MAIPLVLGTSNLMLQNRLYGTLMLIETITIVYIFSYSSDWYKFGTFAFFGLVTVAVIHLRLTVGKIANRFILGWLTLLIGNIFFVNVFNIEWLADAIAIPAKSILALGMWDQRFSKVGIGIKKTSQAYQFASDKNKSV